jgi:hypothetical protein
MEDCSCACGSGWVRQLVSDIFRPKSGEVIGGWRKLHNEELHNMYFFLIIIKLIS